MPSHKRRVQLRKSLLDAMRPVSTAIASSTSTMTKPDAGPHWRGVPDVRGEGSSTPSAYSGTWINRNAIERRERDVPVLQMTDETKRDLQYRERHDCHDRSRRKRAEHATELLTLVSDLFATLHQSNSKLFL